jgi:DNA-directed RNA polymerase specialized sigma24 family protein
MGRRADPAGFDEFVAASEPTLRRALVAALGPNLASDALGEAMAYAWEHWERVRAMDNPVGYLFRVGQTRSRRRRPGFLTRSEPGEPWIEPGLPAAMGELTDQQRVVVTLVHGFGLTHREVGELLEVSPSTVQNLERGLEKLRRRLEVNADA